MTVSELQAIINAMGANKKNPDIQVFSNVGRPADLISMEYCKENNILYLKYETKEKSK